MSNVKKRIRTFSPPVAQAGGLAVKASPDRLTVMSTFSFGPDKENVAPVRLGKPKPKANTPKRKTQTTRLRLSHPSWSPEDDPLFGGKTGPKRSHESPPQFTLKSAMDSSLPQGRPKSHPETTRPFLHARRRDMPPHIDSSISHTNHRHDDAMKHDPQSRHDPQSSGIMPPSIGGNFTSLLDPSPPRPPSIRLGPRMSSNGKKRREPILPNFPLCGEDDDDDDDDMNDLPLATFLFQDEVAEKGLRPPPLLTTGPCLTPRVSGTLSPKEVKSPHWSKPVTINPFSPVPTEEYLETQQPQSDSRVGMYSSRGSPIKGRQQRKSDPLPQPSSFYNSVSNDTSALGQHFTFGLQKNDEDDSPMDTSGSSLPPPTPAKSKARSRLHTEPENDDNDDSTPYSYHPHHPSSHASGYVSHESPPQCCSSLSRFEEDFQVVDEIGHGSFGTVFKCISRLDGCLYAIKVVKREAKGQLDRHVMLKEVYALAALCSQSDAACFHIVRYHQAWMEENRLYIQTELCTSTLQNECSKGMLNDDKQRCKVLREILLALELIHRNGMVHLDIKPDNIFVKNDQYKLGDFGLASKSSTDNDVEEGDSRYMSRELLSGDQKDLTKCDIFSLGATLYEVCLGRPLMSDGPEWQSIRSGVLSPMPGTSLELQAIIAQMMNANPDCRPSAKELLTNRLLLSDEQKQLIAEQNKAKEASRALAIQEEKFKQILLRPPRKRKMVRANSYIL